MQKNLVLLSIFLLFTGFCFSQTNTYFEIDGVVENRKEGKVFLQCYDEKASITDYVSEIKNNKFHFKGKFTQHGRAYLKIDGIKEPQWFFMDTGKINIHVKIDSSKLTLNTTGSHSQEIWDETVEHFGKISRCEAPDSVKSEDYYNAMSAVIKQYPDLYVTPELISVNEHWSYEQMKALYESLPKTQQETQMGARLKSRLETLKITKPNRYIFFPTQKDTQGKNVTLDDLEFTYLLIDFWASWCAPCRREHPDLIASYNRYKAQGFNVLSISLDKNADKEKWLQAIKEDKLPWKQVSDLKSFQTEIATHYGIDFIPYNFLIDRNGKILATDLRGEDLKNKLKELFEPAKQN